MKKKHITTLLKILVAAALITYFLTTNDIKQIWTDFKLLHWGIWGITFVIYLAEEFIRAVKWQRLLPKYKYRQLFLVDVISGFYTLILPGQLVSEAVKAVILGREEKDLERVSASVVVDKITGLISLMLLGTAGIILSKQDISISVTWLFIAGSILMIMALYLINITAFRNMIMGILNWLAKKFKKLTKIVQVFEKLILSWQEFSKDWKTIAVNIVLGIVFQLLSCLMGTVFSAAVGANVTLIDWFWIQAIVSVVLLLPITIGGIGVREGTLIGILGVIGVAPEVAVVISFGFLGQQVMRAVLGGIIELLRNVKVIKIGQEKTE